MSDKYIGNIILEGAATAEDTIVTSSTSNKRVTAQGTLQDTDVRNRNKRVYKKADIKPEINGPRMTELIKAGQFFGECGHPLTDDLVRQQTIDPKLKCVQFLKVWMEENKIKGIFKGSLNEYGNTFDQELREGCKPAFSLRALGSIENEGGEACVKNLKIITWDHVVYPSHKAAYTERVLSESGHNMIPDEYYVNENQIIVPNNDSGTIIKLTESDARTVLNRLQRESANITTIIETFDGLYDNISLLENGKLKMSSKYGETLYVNLENHVDNLIMDYAFKF